MPAFLALPKLQMLSQLPAAGVAGRIAAQGGTLWLDNGSSWIDCGASSASVAYQYAQLASDVTLGTSNVWQNGPSVSLSTGTWAIFGTALIWRTATGSRNVSARLFNSTGSVGLCSTTAYVPSSNPSGATLPLSTIVTLSAASTIVLQGMTFSGSTSEVMRALGIGSSDPATVILALRLQ